MADATEAACLKPGHYLFDAEGRLCHVSVTPDPTQTSDTAIAGESTFDLSTSLLPASLPPDLCTLVRAVAQGQAASPVYLPGGLVATAYPVVWRREKLVALVVLSLIHI